MFLSNPPLPASILCLLAADNSADTTFHDLHNDDQHRHDPQHRNDRRIIPRLTTLSSLFSPVGAPSSQRDASFSHLCLFCIFDNDHNYTQ